MFLYYFTVVGHFRFRWVPGSSWWPSPTIIARVWCLDFKDHHGFTVGFVLAPQLEANQERIKTKRFCQGIGISCQGNAPLNLDNSVIFNIHPGMLWIPSAVPSETGCKRCPCWQLWDFSSRQENKEGHCAEYCGGFGILLPRVWVSHCHEQSVLPILHGDQLPWREPLSLHWYEACLVTVTAFLIGKFPNFLLSLGWGWIALDHCILVEGGPTFQELCKVERDKERTRDPPPSDGCDVHQPTDHQARLVAHGGPWHSSSPVWEFNLGPPGRPYSWKQQANGEQPDSSGLQKPPNSL